VQAFVVFGREARVEQADAKDILAWVAAGIREEAGAQLVRVCARALLWYNLLRRALCIIL